MGDQLFDQELLTARTFLKDSDLSIHHLQIRTGMFTLLAMMVHPLVKSLKIFVDTIDCGPNPLIDGIHLKSNISYLPINLGEELSLRVYDLSVLGQDSCDL